MPQAHSLRHKSDAYSVLAYLMLLDPIRHRAGKLGQAALGKGGFHSGTFGQLGIGCHTGQVGQLHIALPGILVVLQAGHKELQGNGGCQAVINIVERAFKDMQLALPACAAAIERQVAELVPGAVFLFQLQPDGIAFIRRRSGC